MNQVVRILVVDDDPEIVSFLKRGLAYEGYAVETATDGAEALARVRVRKPDLIVLDVMMPEIDGIEVARRMRQDGAVPIIMLTARGTIADKIVGLDSGADDYLVKPFSLDELLARVRARLRHRLFKDDQTLSFADLSLNTATRQVTRGGYDITLTAQEFDLLEMFMRHPRQVLKRDLIHEQVWGYDFENESNVIEVYVRYLRSKLECAGQPRLIHTVRGVGYVLRG